MTDSIRAAIVGAGLMGRWHAHELTRVGGRLIAVADVNEQNAQRLAQVYRAQAFQSLDELLAQSQVDVLHICTPLPTHADLARRGLKSGVHILVEKPLASNADATMKLLDDARAHERLIAPVHQFIFQRGVQNALRGLTNIAPLVHIDFTIATAGATDANDAMRDELIADVLPHPLGLLNRFLAEGIDGIEWQVTHPAPGELRAQGIQHAISISITLSTHGRPTRNAFTMIGERGSIQGDLFHGFAILEPGSVSRTQKIFQPLASSAQIFTAATLNLAERAARNETAYPGLRELIRSFYDAIRRQANAPITTQEIIAVACARDRLIAQAQLKTT